MSALLLSWLSQCSANRQLCASFCQEPSCQVPEPSVQSLELPEATPFQKRKCCCHCGPLLPSCLLPSRCQSSQVARCQAAGCPVHAPEDSDEGAMMTFKLRKSWDISSSSSTCCFPHRSQTKAEESSSTVCRWTRSSQITSCS